jgi:hypothetical protein
MMQGQAIIRSISLESSHIRNRHWLIGRKLDVHKWEEWSNNWTFVGGVLRGPDGRFRPFTCFKCKLRWLWRQHY